MYTKGAEMACDEMPMIEYDHVRVTSGQSKDQSKYEREITRKSNLSLRPKLDPGQPLPRLISNPFLVPKSNAD
jgi:hypothetical protein